MPQRVGQPTLVEVGRPRVSLGFATLLFPWIVDIMDPWHGVLSAFGYIGCLIQQLDWLAHVFLCMQEWKWAKPARWGGWAASLVVGRPGTWSGGHQHLACLCLFLSLALCHPFLYVNVYLQPNIHVHLVELISWRVNPFLFTCIAPFGW